MPQSDESTLERSSGVSNRDSEENTPTDTSQQVKEGGLEAELTEKDQVPNSDPDTSEQEYLIALNYQSDAERKRVEYLLDTHSGITVEKIRGLARIVRADDKDFEQFHEKLSAKVDGLDHLRVNELSDIDITPDENHERFSMETEAPPDRVQWAFDTIERKRDATLEDRARDKKDGYRQYVVTTKSGTVRYSYELHNNGEDSTRVDIHVWGFGEAPVVFREFIEEELNYAI